MANDSVQSSFSMKNLTEKEMAWWEENLSWGPLELRNEERERKGQDKIGEITSHKDGSTLYVWGEDQFDIEGFIDLAQDFFSKFPTDRVIAFSWAETCSRPIPDAFGGGSVVITRNVVTLKSTGETLENMINEASNENLEAVKAENTRLKGLLNEHINNLVPSAAKEWRTLVQKAITGDGHPWKAQ